MGMRTNPGQERWRWRAALLATVAAVGPSAVLAHDAQAGQALPDERAYEMVTPVNKNGGDVTGVLTTSSDGDRLAYYSPASFPGAESNNSINSNLAQRGSDGWMTRAMQPPVGTAGIAVNGGYYNADFTGDLSQSILLTRSGAAEPNTMNVFLTQLDGSTSWLTAPTVVGVPIDDKAYAGRSADGSHIIFESAQQLVAQPTITGRQVWELVDGHVRLVSLLPDGSVEPTGTGVGVGINGSVGRGTGFNGTLVQPDVVSEDGSKIFFGAGGSGSTQRVFVRIDGRETREITLSQRSGSIGQPATNAQFVGASADGNVSLFMSPEQMTNDATPNGGLYAFDLRGSKLRFLSSGATDPNGAQVEALSLISRDGGRVYFIAQSQLVPGEGVAGGHNLYVADHDGVSFITTLGNDDAQNWNPSVGNANARIAKATADGRYFVFQSWERITSVDNAGHQEIYLYDAERRTIACVSCGVSGHAPGGDASVISNPVPRGGLLQFVEVGRPRTLTDDGSRIYFQTTDSLVPQDVNGLADVYEYWTATGAVSLISAGTGGYDSEIADNSPDGRDVFFFTRDSLVKGDTDGGAKDVYDARSGGGFPDQPVPTTCTEDACQLNARAAPASLAPGTIASPKQTTGKRRAARLFVHPVTTTGKRNAVRTGRLALVVSTDAAGTVRAAATATYGKRTIYRLKSTSVKFRSAATMNLHLSLPAAVKDKLKHHHRVKLAITVSHDKATRPVRVALTLS